MLDMQSKLEQFTRDYPEVNLSTVAQWELEQKAAAESFAAKTVKKQGGVVVVAVRLC